MKTARPLLDIYDALRAAFGHQHWWPADTRDETVIGAILAQNVAWSNVEKAISQLKAHGLLTLSAIDGAEDQKIAELIRSTRFFNQKAQRLKCFTGFLNSHFSGDLDKMLDQPTDRIRKMLLGLKGFGEETVDSILLYAGSHPLFVVDAYTRRICARMGLIESGATYFRVQQFFMTRLPEDPELFNDYHAQLVRLGNSLCTKTKPKCDACPLYRKCRKILTQ